MRLLEDLHSRLPDMGEVALMQAASDAEGTILDICNRTSIPASMYNLHLALAEVYARRMAAGGEASRSEGDVSVSYAYSTAVPDDLLKRLMARRKLKQAEVINSEA